MAFHEVRFPTEISLGARGGPEWRTEIVALGSGFEERNQRWSQSRRTYDAGYGLRSLDDLHAVVAFFEERRGRFHGFRWKDHADWKSCPPGSNATALDQVIGTGDGMNADFQLAKRYGQFHAPLLRAITKPVAGSVMIAVAGLPATEGVEFDVDPTTGTVAFRSGYIPSAGATVTAGFSFDVPVRFDADRIEVDLQGFRHGSIPAIPVVELRV